MNFTDQNSYNISKPAAMNVGNCKKIVLNNYDHFSKMHTNTVTRFMKTSFHGSVKNIFLKTLGVAQHFGSRTKKKKKKPHDLKNTSTELTISLLNYRARVISRNNYIFSITKKRTRL